MAWKKVSETRIKLSLKKHCITNVIYRPKRQYWVKNWAEIIESK